MCIPYLSIKSIFSKASTQASTRKVGAEEKKIDSSRTSTQASRAGRTLLFPLQPHLPRVSRACLLFCSRVSSSHARIFQRQTSCLFESGNGAPVCIVARARRAPPLLRPSRSAAVSIRRRMGKQRAPLLREYPYLAHGGRRTRRTEEVSKLRLEA